MEGEELFELAELETRGQDFIGILTSDANADANSIESGKSAYVNGKKIEGTLTGENDIKATTKKQNYHQYQSLFRAMVRAHYQSLSTQLKSLLQMQINQSC